LASRLADGLDGAVARATQKTDRGGYLDIVCDYAFYAAVPLGFAIADPAANAVAACAMLFSFYVNGGSFLGYAILAEKHGLSTDRRGSKSLYFTGGLGRRHRDDCRLRSRLPRAHLVPLARLRFHRLGDADGNRPHPDGLADFQP
jgi:hypothetical protein